MIPTIPFDAIAGYVAGSLVAFTARDPLSREGDPLRTRYFAVVALFACGALMPAGIVLYVQYPDWSLMYLANPAHLHSVIMVPVVAALYLAMPAAGFVLTHRIVAADHERLARAVLVGCGVAVLLLLVFGWERLMTVAYYDDYYYGGEIVPLYESPLVWPLALIVFFVGFAFVFSVLHVRRHVASMQAASARPAGSSVDDDLVDTVDGPKPSR